MLETPLCFPFPNIFFVAISPEDEFAFPMTRSGFWIPTFDVKGDKQKNKKNKKAGGSLSAGHASVTFFCGSDQPLCS